MTGSHIHFLESSSDPSSSRNNVQVVTPKSPNSDSAWSDSEEGGSNSQYDTNRTLKKKLTDQIDVEILLKHREYKLIEQEIAKVEQVLLTLEQLHDDEKYGEYVTQLITLKRKANGILLQDQGAHGHHHHHHHHHSHHVGGPLLNQSIDPVSNPNGLTITRSSLRPSTSGSAGGSSSGNVPSVTGQNNAKNDHRTSYGGIPSLVLPNGQKICVHRLANGKLVKISCPVCSRTDFGSAQGFLNHARLLHQLEFKSQGDVALKCGVELNEWENELWGQQQQFHNESELNNIDSTHHKKKVKMDSTHNTSKHKVKYLTKVVPVDDNESFNELVKDVTSKDRIESDNDDDPESPGGTTIISNVSSVSKGHNRRKSRGGLSSVKFEEDINTSNELNDLSSDPGMSPSLNSEDNKLTPAQRRRVPSIPNPLRTRSRSSRENSR